MSNENELIDLLSLMRREKFVPDPMTLDAFECRLRIIIEDKRQTDIKLAKLIRLNQETKIALNMCADAHRSAIFAPERANVEHWINEAKTYLEKQPLTEEEAQDSLYRSIQEVVNAS